MDKIQYLIIHCTDSPDRATHIGVDDVRQWHKQRGYKNIGYEWLVDKLGIGWVGRSEDIPGAHAYGYNDMSVGMVWVGRNDCNDKQWDTLIEISIELIVKYNIPLENVLGHCELPGVTKTCPNLNMTKFRNAVKQRLESGISYE